MPKCPYCGSEDLTPIKSWRFRFYEVMMYRRNKCGGILHVVTSSLYLFDFSMDRNGVG